MRLKQMFPVLITTLVLSSLSVFAKEKEMTGNLNRFEVDRAHSYFSFKASTLLFDVPGRFSRYEVNISGDPDTLNHPSIRIEIDADSIQTDNVKRDSHLKDKDFFSVKEYPKITFTSTQVTKQAGKLLVKGTLEMRGMKKEMTLLFEAIKATNGAGTLEYVYRTDFVILRKDFGLGADSVAAKISLKDKVAVQILLAGFFVQTKV